MSRCNRFLLVCALLAAPLALVGCAAPDDGIDGPVGVKGKGPPPPLPHKTIPKLGTG
jgi:hypothetical protein